MIFADLHCHPALFGFNRLRQSELDGSEDLFHAWTIPDDVDHRAMAEGKRAATYTQCTMPMLLESQTRIVYASITPIEKGFFVGSEQVHEETRFSMELVKLVSGASVVGAARHLVRGRRMEAGATLAAVLKNRGPFRRAFQRMFLKYSSSRIAHMISEEYDYFEELLREYTYYANADGVEHRAVLHTSNGPDREVTGRYQMIRDGEHLREVIEETDDLAMIMTIEGSHAFSIAPDGSAYGKEQIEEHIGIMRDLPAPFFFVTFAHHFDNGLCGHAHSLPDAAGWVMDQSERMEQGFNELGQWTARKLLGIDENLKDTGERRILLDCKHMSPRSRKEYYEEIVRPYNARAEQGGARPIPVVISHSCFSGVDTLDELIENRPNENDHWHKNPFLAWGINHSAEDVRMVWESGGLIGFCFDQRICGTVPRQTVPLESWADILFHQILATVDVVLQDERIPREERLSMWDRVCIGSDYDGLIDPITAYPTVLELPRLAEDLRERFARIEHTRGISEIGLELLIEKFCWRNGYDFAVANF